MFLQLILCISRHVRTHACTYMDTTTCEHRYALTPHSMRANVGMQAGRPNLLCFTDVIFCHLSLSVFLHSFSYSNRAKVEQG